jgi:two-component system chemotaxis response regulator CheB
LELFRKKPRVEAMAEEFTLDRPYTLTCPECGGALYPAEPAPAYLQFRCHIGHTYVWTAMLEAHQARTEATLGTALVLLKERAELCRQLQECPEADAKALAKMVDEALKKAEIMKRLLEQPWIAMPRPRLVSDTDDQ